MCSCVWVCIMPGNGYIEAVVCFDSLSERGEQIAGVRGKRGLNAGNQSVEGFSRENERVIGLLSLSLFPFSGRVAGK